MTNKGYVVGLAVTILVLIFAATGVYIAQNYKSTSTSDIPPQVSLPVVENEVESRGMVLEVDEESGTENENDIPSKVIQLQKPSVVLGYGKYDGLNLSHTYIRADMLRDPLDDSETNYDNLCASNEKSGMEIFTKYLAIENQDFILDDPDRTEKEKQDRRADGYGSFYLVDNWKADTHYHYVITTKTVDTWPRHVILEDCNYFTPETKDNDRASLDDTDYSESIGTFTYTPKNSDSFLDFIKYYYGREGTSFVDRRLHDVSVLEDTNSVTISFKVVSQNFQDWGIPTEYTYYVISHLLNKTTGNVKVTWKQVGTRTTGYIDEEFLK